MDAVSEIKARLPIEELVSGYCQLQRRGRTLCALCPFHNDSHPSLTVSPDKGIAYCFACQSGGDIFSFYQKIENVDFVQALKDLAEKTGVLLPKEQFREGIKKDEKDRFHHCLEAASAFYQNMLHENEHAQKYLRDRRVPEELIAAFGVGYAPHSFDATYTHLLKAGFSRKEILGAGLGVQKELQEERIYDRFRNRIMFPIMDVQGAVIGFGGRTLGNDDAKYINSPDGPLYNKSVALFGLSHAREAIRERKCVLLVEGYFDVLACHRLGIRHVVAVSGTALTEQHAAVLKRYTERLCLCLDADAAGMQAAERAFTLCAKHDLDVRSLTLPQGKDPDECSLLAPEEMVNVCKGDGTPYLDFVLEEVKRSNREKREILRRLLPLFHALASSVLREEYITKLATLLGTTVTAVQDDLRHLRAPPTPPSEQHRLVTQPSFSSTEFFFGLLLAYPHHIAMIERLIEPHAETEKALYNALRSHYAVLRRADSGEKGSTHSAPHHPQRLRTAALSETCQERASILQLYCEEHFGTWSEGMLMKEIQKLLRKANRDLLLRKQQELITSIKRARLLGKKIEEEQLLTQYQKVLKLTQIAS